MAEVKKPDNTVTENATATAPETNTKTTEKEDIGWWDRPIEQTPRQIRRKMAKWLGIGAAAGVAAVNRKSIGKYLKSFFGLDDTDD